MVDPILIVGLPGSGDVEVAEALARCGVWLDTGDAAAVGRRLARTLKQRWHGAAHDDEPLLRQLERDAGILVTARAEHRHWAWLEPDAPLTLPYWLRVFPDLRLVICMRDPESGSAALRARHRYLAAAEALALWGDFYESLRPYSARAAVVRYDEFARAPAVVLGRLLPHIGIDCRSDEIDAIAVSLEHSTDAAARRQLHALYAAWPDVPSSAQDIQTAVPPSGRAQAARARADAFTDMPELEQEHNSLKGLIRLMLFGRRRRLKQWAKDTAIELLARSSGSLRTSGDDPFSITLVTVLDAGAATADDRFGTTLRSVMAQTARDWRWIIACDAPPVDLMAVTSSDSRIVFHPLPSTLSAVERWNAVLREATSTYLMPVFAGDQLAKSALANARHALQAQPGSDCLYSDTGYRGRFGRPKRFYKPDWSPMMMFSVNLLDGLLVISRSLLDRTAPLDAALGDGAYWDFCWRVAENADAIRHLPAILSTRPHDLAPAADTQRVVRQAYLARKGVAAPTSSPLRWTTASSPLISIVIPSKDKAELLGACLRSLFSLTAYPAFEVIVVDTGSTETATHTLYASYTNEPRFRVVRYPHTAFNFSRACNVGAAHGHGDLILFLNNDTEILHADWLALMAQWFADPSVGIIGPKLLYPDGPIQHAGVVVGMSGLADHVWHECAENRITIYGSDAWFRNHLAVTGACLMISRVLFTKIGGFSEAYQLNFSDVELCLQAIRRGYQVAYTPDVRLLHHEGQTRDYDVPRGDFEQASRDFRPWLIRGDPYFNPNLSYRHRRPHANRLRFTTPFPSHVVAMSRLRTRVRRRRRNWLLRRLIP